SLSLTRRSLPVPLFGSPAPSMQDERQTQSRGEHGAAEHPDKADTPQLSAAWQPSDAGIDGFEIALDRGEIRASLIGLAEGEALLGIVGHVPDCPLLVTLWLSAAVASVCATCTCNYLKVGSMLG